MRESPRDLRPASSSFTQKYVVPPPDILAGAEEGSMMASSAMDLDDADPFDVLGADFDSKQSPPIDADFFNSFEDDFDDDDIN